jgi:uncharacterized membrane protein HdeD (DUF308 family)
MPTTFEYAEAQAAAKAIKLSLILRGLVALVVGVIALVAPAETIHGLLVLFGIFVIIDGVIAVVGSLATRDERWGWGIFLGLLGIVLGIVAIRYPQATVLAMMLVIAAWALIGGMFQIYASVVLKSGGVKGWGWVLFGGLISLAIGILFFVNPIAGTATIVLIFGIYLVVLGIALLIAGFTLGSLAKGLDRELARGA